MRRSCSLIPLAQIAEGRKLVGPSGELPDLAKRPISGRLGAQFPSMIGTLLISCTVYCATATTASAADEEFVGRLAIAVEDDVAKIIGLDDSRRQQLIELVRSREDAYMELRTKLKSLPDEERQKMLGRFRHDSETKGKGLLEPLQWELLGRVWLKRRGMESLAEPKVAQMLGLSEEQHEQVMNLLRERNQRMAEADLDSQHTIVAETGRDLAKILSDEQRAKWDMITSLQTPLNPSAPGEPPGAEAQDPKPSEPAMPPKPADIEPAEAPAAEEAVQPEPAQPEPAQPEAVQPEPMQPPVQEESEPVPAWARSEPGEPMDPILPPDLAGAFDPLPSESDTLTFNFSFHPWEDVIHWFADRAGLSVLSEKVPLGTFNYRDNREYTPLEALDVLNKALLIKGYRLIKAERMLIVIDLEDGIPPDLISTVSLEELDELSQYDLVRVLFELEKLDPVEAEEEIQKLIGLQGSVIVMPKSRQILVTDTVGTLRTIRRVIERIEDPEGGASSEVMVYQPRNILADEAMMVLRQLLDIGEDENATSDGSLRLAVDPLGSKIYYSGKSEMRDKVAQIMERLDEDLIGGETGPVESLQIEIFPITTADPASVLSVTQTILAESPGVRLSLDPKTSSLIAMARPSEHAKIRAILDQMQSEVRRIEVINLRSIDPSLAALSIKKMFGEASEENTSAPTVESDSVSRQLLIYGTDAQIEQIGVLLEKMGEQTLGGAQFVDTSTYRMIPLGGREAEAVLERIEMIWPTLRTNRIKVVTPSAVIPTLRPGSRGEPSPMGDDVLRELLKMSPDFRVPALEGTSPAPPATQQPPAATTPNRTQPGATPPAAGPVETTLPDSLERKNRTAATGRPVYSPWAPIRMVAEDTDQPNPAAQSTELAQQPPAVTQEKTSGDPPPIVVSIGSGGLMIACEDPEVLNEFEELIKMLSAGSMSTAPKMTVFYLIHAKVEPVAQTIDAVLGGGTMATSSDSGGGGGLLGDLAGAALGDVGGGILGSLLGFGMGGGSITPTGSIQITPDARLNCLFVQANSADLNMIEELLKILDQAGSPEDVLADPKPQMIPVFNMQADEVSAIVKEVFAENFAKTTQNRQPSPQEFMEALRGGRGGSRGSSRGRSADTTPTMTVSVDARSNALIVSAPEDLFQKVRALVEMVDQAAGDSPTDAIQVVKLDSMNPEAIQAALEAMVGENVSFGASKSGGSSSSSRGSSPGSSSGRPPGSSSSSDDARRAMFMRAMQERMRSGGGGSSFGGGRPGGGSSFGGGRPGGGGGPVSGRPGGR